MIRGRAARHWNRASERISWIERPEPLTSVNILENFMISKFPVHGTGCSDSYNFLVSQRRDVILWESKIHTRADQTISKCFQNTPCKAGGKPSTWLPPGGFAERFRKQIHNRKPPQTNKIKQKQAKSSLSYFIKLVIKAWWFWNRFVGIWKVFIVTRRFFEN